MSSSSDPRVHFKETTEPGAKISLLSDVSVSNPTPNFARFTFLFLGIASLIGWNAILIGLDFFLRKFPGFDVAFYFSIPMFVASNLQNGMIHWLARYVSINQRIIIGLLGQMVLVILLPIEANYFSSEAGFYLALFLIFLEGIVISLMQTSAVAFASLISSECINDFFTGTGLGGVLICCIRLIVLAIIGGDNDNELFLGTLIYVIVAGVILLLTVAIYRFLFYRSSYCKQVLARSIRKTLNNAENIMDQIVVAGMGVENLPIVEEEDEHNMTDKNCLVTQLNEAEVVKLEAHQNRSNIWDVFKRISPMPLLVWLIYVQTFMVFPGLALQKNIDGLNAAWGSTLLVLTYNIGDFLGKYLCSYRKFYNKWSSCVLILGRFLFYYSFIVILTEENAGVINTSWFAFLNMLVFAMSNGYATSAVMVLGPEQVRTKDEKETTGFIMNNGLYLGMMSGAFLALTFKNIGK